MSTHRIDLFPAASTWYEATLPLEVHRLRPSCAVGSERRHRSADSDGVPGQCLAIPEIWMERKPGPMWPPTHFPSSPIHPNLVTDVCEAKSTDPGHLGFTPRYYNCQTTARSRNETVLSSGILCLIAHLLKRRHGQRPVPTRTCHEGVVGRCPEADTRELQPHRTPTAGIDAFGICHSILRPTHASIFEPLSVCFGLKAISSSQRPKFPRMYPSHGCFKPFTLEPSVQA